MIFRKDLLLQEVYKIRISDNISSDSMEQIGKVIEVDMSNILQAIPPFRPNQNLLIKINKEGIEWV